MSDLNSPKRAWPQLFVGPDFDVYDNARAHHAQYCRSLPAHERQPTFTEWLEMKSRRGNREGCNHD
jgi:hypothetical protein